MNFNLLFSIYYRCFISDNVKMNKLACPAVNGFGKQARKVNIVCDPSTLFKMRMINNDICKKFQVIYQV